MSKKNDRENDPQDVLVGELKEIKGLLVLLLTKAGATQGDIAKAMSSSQPTVSRLYPFGDVEPIHTRNE